MNIIFFVHEEVSGQKTHYLLIVDTVLCEYYVAVPSEITSPFPPGGKKFFAEAVLEFR
jgi:hypothetical protein